MKLLFQGQSEVVLYIIDRKNKNFKLFSSKTNYQLQEMPWKMLFDKGQEKFQDELTQNLSDEEFKFVMRQAMAQYGYKKKANKHIEPILKEFG